MKLKKGHWIGIGIGVATLATGLIMFRKQIFGTKAGETEAEPKESSSAPMTNPPVTVPDLPQVPKEPANPKSKWGYIVKDNHIARNDAVPAAPTIKVFKRGDRVWVYDTKNEFYKVGWPKPGNPQIYQIGYVYKSAIQIA